MATSTDCAVTFEVSGDPVPQPRPRHVVIAGRPMAFVPREHPIHSYRESLAIAARAAGVNQLRGALCVQVEAVFARPPSHVLKSGALRKGAPGWPRPDWDNIAKGVCDAIFEQDSVVVSGGCDKRYAEAGEPAHTRVVVTRRFHETATADCGAAADHP